MYLEHYFEDLGLSLDGGWTIGSDITGTCVVAFDASGDWWIEDIHVNIRKGTGGSDGYLLDRTKPKERKRYHDLRDLIMELCKDDIEEKVSDRLSDGYEPRSTISAGRTYP